MLLYLYVNTKITNIDSNWLRRNTYLVQIRAVEKERIDTMSNLKEVTLFLQLRHLFLYLNSNI